MIEVDENGKSLNGFIEIPESYTIDNQLIVIVVQSFLHQNLFENFTEEVVEGKRKELANLLLLKLKLPIFKVELTLVDNML